MITLRIKRVYVCQLNRLHRCLYNFFSKNKSCFPNLYDRYRYFYLSGGEKLNWKNPIKLNEKLFWLNRYWQSNDKINCADKVLMHSYLKRKQLNFLSVPIIGIWENAKNIDFDILPNKFVLKANHGCGFNIICTDKRSLNIEKTIYQLNEWLKVDYGAISNERHYSRIKPMILCEEYLSDESGVQIKDYKVYCINGKVEYILICSERNIYGDDAKYNTYSDKWEELDYILDNEKGELENKPDFLEDLINYSSILSEHFPFVRLDYYYVDGKLYLGEFTFTPQGNFITYKSEWIQYFLGNKLVLPRKGIK